jgi:hypothetical protein
MAFLLLKKSWINFLTDFTHGALCGIGNINNKIIDTGGTPE